MSSEESDRGNKPSLHPSITADVSSVDSSDHLNHRVPTQSTPSAALWSYSKQWSSKGFSRVFSKVFGPSRGSQTTSSDTVPKQKPSEPQIAVGETNQAPVVELISDKAQGEQPTDPCETPVAAVVVDLTDVDPSTDNQDIAVQTLMNLKRHAISPQEPIVNSTKPPAQKPKSSVHAATEEKRWKNRGIHSTPLVQRDPRPTMELLYRPLSVNDLVTKRQEILSAVALVTRTLMSGSYPSPFKMSSVGPSDVEATTRNMDDATSSTLHATHMSAVCASLEKFTNDIVIPSFVGELHSTLVPEATDDDGESIDSNTGVTALRNTDVPEKVTRHDNDLRVFFGTLLLLREVLVQNFDNVFGPHAASGLPIEEHIAASKNDSEIDQLSKQIFVTAIILTGISIFFGGNDDGSRDQSEELIQAFFKTIGDYDRGHAAFVNCLQIVGNSTVAVFPNQQEMNEIERVAWQISCNLQRSLHPLYSHEAMSRQYQQSANVVEARRHENRTKRRKVLINVPAPTAVHISILKIQSNLKTSDCDSPS